MSLVSSHKTSDSGLLAHLHPLVLLTISDYITRHTLRQFTRPITGALLGQQSGRSISLEHAFECEVIEGPHGEVLLHEAWFKDRLQQYKDVHKAPALELVGWFTTAPVTGPEACHVPIHRQILQTYNETAILLAFHPASVLERGGVGGKLPLTIYESVYESAGDVDKGMEIDGAEKDAPLDLRFRELPYSVETGEAEMISVDSVARGGGNATAIDRTVKTSTKGQASQRPVGTIDPKEIAMPNNTKSGNDSSILSPEDEELIASLTARANAVKMLHTRIHLLKTYLTSLPPSYLTTTTDPPHPNPQPSASTSTPPPSSTPPQDPPPNHPLLRSLLSLLSRLPLLLPTTALSDFKLQTLAEKSDVELVSLLSTLGQSAKDARDLGRKFGTVDGVRGAAGRKGGGGSGGGMSLSEGLLRGEPPPPPYPADASFMPSGLFP